MLVSDSQSTSLSGKSKPPKPPALSFSMRLREKKKKNLQKYINPTLSSELCGCFNPEIRGGGKGNYSFLKSGLNHTPVLGFWSHPHLLPQSASLCGGSAGHREPGHESQNRRTWLYHSASGWQGSENRFCRDMQPYFLNGGGGAPCHRNTILKAASCRENRSAFKTEHTGSPAWLLTSCARLSNTLTSRPPFLHLKNKQIWLDDF